MTEKHPRFKLLTEQIERRKAMVKVYEELNRYWLKPYRVRQTTIRINQSEEFIQEQIAYTADKLTEHQKVLINYERELDS
jgi:ABC-type Zn uptake system ZnuABC Zn-binding protein ZnuA